jgi:Tuberculosis necrotizing toxin
MTGQVALAAHLSLHKEHLLDSVLFLPIFASKPVNSYEVMKPVGAEAGITAPWFNQQGGGIQFELGKHVQSLLDSGHSRSR